MIWAINITKQKRELNQYHVGSRSKQKENTKLIDAALAGPHRPLLENPRRKTPSKTLALTFGCALLRSLTFATLLSFHSQIVIEVEAFGQKLRDTALALGDVSINDKLAVDSHVVERVEL